MSFSAVRSVSASRFSETQILLNYITTQEATNPTDPTPLEVKIMRGLFYVQLYAALEKSINEVVQKSLLLINSKCVKNNHYIIPFNTISVYDKIQSLKECGYKKITERSIQLFAEVASKNVKTLNETTFSTKLQNVWIESIEEVMIAFGMQPLTLSARERATIDEIVDKRNSVAHGGESPAFVGERHRSSTLRVKLQIAQDFTVNVIDRFEDYYNNKNYLKPAMKRHYA